MLQWLDSVAGPGYVAAILWPFAALTPLVVVLPVLGAVDPDRGEQMTSTLVERIARDGVRCAIVDLTGVDTVDTRTAQIFVRMARATKLLGSDCLITGVRPEVAQTLTTMGVELQGLEMRQTLSQALAECLHRLGYAVTAPRRR